jgi:thiol:disulfide interchange protein DsbC
MKTQPLLAALALLTLIAAQPGFAAGASKSDAKAAATITENLKERFPDVKVVSVQPSQFPGLYEVFTGDAVAYTNPTGDLIFSGSIIDTRTKRDLTAARVDELNAIDFAALPLERAIKIVKGSGSRKVAVFSDPECPFCQELEKSFASVSDVTIYTFLFPIASLHPDAPARARAVWCSADRVTAWKEWMIDRKPPEWKTCDGDPLDELKALGERLRVNSTPTVFASSGRRFAGAMPAPELEKFIDGRPKDERKAGDAIKGAPTARN